MACGRSSHILRWILVSVLSGILVLGGLVVFSFGAEMPAGTVPDVSADDDAPPGGEPVDPVAEQLRNLLYKPDMAAPRMGQDELQNQIDRAIREGLSTVKLTGNVRLTESLKVRGMKQSLTIDGNGYTLLFAETGSEKNRHILITQPDGFNLSLTLYNIRLEGPGNGVTGGGVTVGSGMDIILDTCVITGCAAREGGAIYNYNNDIYLYDAIVAANVAETGGGLYSYYGSIYIEGGHTELSANSATSGETGGGAVYGHQGNILITGGVRFIDNSAVRSGGAVLLQSGGLVMADSSIFSGNTAADGGAVAAGEETNDIQITACQVIYNAARGRPDGNGGFGGGIYRQGGGGLMVINSLFAANKAVFGGAVLTGSGDEDKLDISGSIFRGNSAVYDGGAIYSSDRITAAQPKPAVLTTVRLDSNEAGRNGGAIYSPNHAALRLSGVIFSGNSARTSLDWDIEAPGDIYAGEAAIYKTNVLRVEASRHPQGETSLQFANVYNNWDINFPVNVTITFRSWGGRWADTSNMENRRQVLFVGETVSLPASTVREGYLFGGWRVATTGHPDEGKVWHFGDPMMRTTALDAVWLEADGAATFIMKPMGGTWGDGTSRNKTVYAEKGGHAYQPDTLSRPGYRFLGWFSQLSNVRWNFMADRLTLDNVVLVARWAALPAESPEGVVYNPNMDDHFVPGGSVPSRPEQMPGFDLIYDDQYPLEGAVDGTTGASIGSGSDAVPASSPQGDRPAASAAAT